MDQEKLLEAINTIVGELRADMAKLEKKADAIIASKGVGSKRMDYVDDTDTGAVRTAADSVGRGEFAAMARTISDLRKHHSRPAADLRAFEDVQAKADAVRRVHGERAEPPLVSEDILAYKVRQHRPLQKHSDRWRNVDLHVIAADGIAFENILTDIRADALAAGKNPRGLPLFQWKEFVEDGPGGHRIRSFAGTGTIFAQMSPPVRRVMAIGPRRAAAGQ